MKTYLNIIRTLTVASVATILGSLSAKADVITLTFEGLGNNAAIGNYYNGGAVGNYGISFWGDSLALISYAGGGTGNFSNNPSGDTVAYFLSGPGDVMNVTGGFDTGFSFYYADQVGYTGSVSVYTGLNGSGSLLASLSLPSTPNPYTVFTPIGVTFGGTAQSVVFSGAANYIAFDNITLGSETPGGSGVPDGGTSVVLLSMGMLRLAGISRRLRR